MELESSFVCPGQRLARLGDFGPGEGTYVRQNFIYASVVGEKEVVRVEDRDVINVKKGKEPSIVPEEHSIVIAKVTKINQRFANVEIQCVNGVTIKEQFSGIIRQHDVRATEPDKVEIYKCFRPGDIIKAEVISLGDRRSYFLSTAKNELGVIFAKSVAGATMIPVSWDQMQCPKTKMKEFRKVAKVI